ncbi:MAG: SDR family oxidoreductase [Hahellaceae bacterium]|nr:SDR family oxidoreductase [Hahellaceae bacterium]
MSFLEGKSLVPLEETLVALGARYAAEHGFNDVYTLTKWMGEALVHKTLKGQAVSIVRPAIVESTLSEPTANWLEGVKVCDAVLFAWAHRKTMVMPGDVNTSIDIIPVDLVTNAMMLASADVLSRSSGVETYQVGSSDVNPILLGQFTKILQQYCLANIDRLDNLFLERPSRFFFLLKRQNFARLMSVLSGFMRLAALMGGSKLYRNFQVTCNLALVFGFYSTSSYRFKIDNLDKLAARFEADRAAFPCDPRAIEWTSYLEGHAEGVNTYAMRPRNKKTNIVAEQQTGAVEGDEQVA